MSENKAILNDVDTQAEAIERIRSIYNSTATSLGKQTQKLMEMAQEIYAEKVACDNMPKPTIWWNKFTSDLETQVGFGKKVATKFVEIYRDPNIREKVDSGRLPPRYNTLYDMKATIIASRALGQNLNAKDMKKWVQDNDQLIQSVWEAMMSGYTWETKSDPQSFKLTPHSTQAELNAFYEGFAVSNGYKEETSEGSDSSDEAEETKETFAETPIETCEFMDGNILVRLPNIDSDKQAILIKGIERLVRSYSLESSDKGQVLKLVA